VRTDGRTMAEKRFPTAIQAQFESGPLTAKGEIQNVGHGGLFLGTRTIPEQGDLVEIEFAAPSGDRIRVSGIVWWTSPDRTPRGQLSGFGVCLLDADDPYTRFVDAIVN
jgi:Tfp pilus assembly protein PilZ